MIMMCNTGIFHWQLEVKFFGKLKVIMIGDMLQVAKEGEIECVVPDFPGPGSVALLHNGP
jgi:hypothetical protein